MGIETEMKVPLKARDFYLPNFFSIDSTRLIDLFIKLINHDCGFVRENFKIRNKYEEICSLLMIELLLHRLSLYPKKKSDDTVYLSISNIQ